MKRWHGLVACALLGSCATTSTVLTTEEPAAPHISRYYQQEQREYPGDTVNGATDHLMLAAAQGEVAKVDPLLEQGALIDGWSGATPYLTAAFAAAANGHLDTLKYLMARGARLDIKAYGVGYTVLHYAAYGGHSEMLRFLLEQGVEANVRDAEGRTALHAAAFEGHRDAVRVLLEHGARNSLRDHSGRTAEDVAASRGHAEVAALLHGE